jgi:hypothetical protein
MTVMSICGIIFIIHYVSRQPELFLPMGQILKLMPKLMIMAGRLFGINILNGKKYSWAHLTLSESD